MLNIELSDGILERLKEMLEDDDSCIRIREYKIGQACHTRIKLGPSIDEYNEDEDEKMDINGISFIIEQDLILKYGSNFRISIDEAQEIAVKSLSSSS